jgi:V-type H+-transporting ATPase subunit C
MRTVELLQTEPRCSCSAQVKVSEFNSLKSQLAAVARKQTGSLSVRDISTMVKPQQLVDSENLATLFVSGGP